MPLGEIVFNKIKVNNTPNLVITFSTFKKFNDSQEGMIQKRKLSY
jgi:hypothetical protein